MHLRPTRPHARMAQDKQSGLWDLDLEEAPVEQRHGTPRIDGALLFLVRGLGIGHRQVRHARGLPPVPQRPRS